MSSEVKQRKKGSNPSPKESQRSSAASVHRTPPDENTGKTSMTVTAVPVQGSGLLDLRTVLCCLCLAVCGALTWTVFQQSHNFTLLEQKYQSLQEHSSSLEKLEAKVGDLFGKFEETSILAAKLKELQIQQLLERLQTDVANMKGWTDHMSGKRRQLEGNLTTLDQTVSQIEQSTAAIAKDVSGKISTVKTDIRRVTGMEDDLTLLTDSVRELEEKLAKVEKNTAQSMGDALAHSVERIMTLKSRVSTNSNRIDHIKLRLGELRGNYTSNFDKLSGLESDRMKILQAVNFANELKPKVFTLRKDFVRLEDLLNDLSLRIGRLAADLMNREKDINTLNDKMYNLTVIKSDILALSDKISNA